MSNRIRSGITGDIVEGLLIFNKCYEKGPFRSAAGRAANRKINLDKVKTDSTSFNVIVGKLAKRAGEVSSNIITAVPEGANRFGNAVAERLGMEFLQLTKPMIKNPEQKARNKILELCSDKELVIIEDVTSTRFSTLEVANYLGGRCVKLALSIVDRGIDVPGVRTLEQSSAYDKDNPNSPPAHIFVDFECDALLKKPLPLLVNEQMTIA